jgi:putative peptidoglycan lipid II flippase
MLAQNAAGGSMDEVRRLVTLGLRMSAFFGIPAAVGLALLAGPVVSLIYERGAFTAEDARETARILQGYAGALVFSGVFILTQAFYALRDTRAILATGVVMLVTTGILGALLVGPVGQAGLGLAFSGGYAAGYFTALGLFIRRGGMPDVRRITSGAARAAVCAALMGGVVWILGRATATHVVAQAAAGAGVFALLARLLCGEEWKHARKLWARADT